MSTTNFPLTLPPTTLTPGMSASDGQTPLPLLQQIENIPSTLAKGFGANKGQASQISSWLSMRPVILILGLILIVAGLFSHPAVRETIITGAKRAGKVAAAAAA